MIYIDKSVLRLLNDAPNPSVYKIFLFIALNQPDEGIYGFRFTKDDLIAHLNSSKTAIFRDLKWLKDNLLVQELKLAEDFDFMANPRFVMNNSDYQERFAEWNRRCNLIRLVKSVYVKKDAFASYATLKNLTSNRFALTELKFSAKLVTKLDSRRIRGRKQIGG